MKKLAVIPAYNEAGNIEKTVKDIIENAPSFDYIVINNMKRLSNAGVYGVVIEGMKFAKKINFIQ